MTNPAPLPAPLPDLTDEQRDRLSRALSLAICEELDLLIARGRARLANEAATQIAVALLPPTDDDAEP